MSSRALQRVTPTDGWSAEGKTPAEIAADIRQTRYRMDAELEALGEKLNPKRFLRPVKKAKWPAAGVALALVALWIRRRARR